MPESRHAAWSRILAPASCWLARVIAGAGLAALLAGCGGGSLFIGVDIGGPNDREPSVALSSAVSEAPAGASVRLAAAATDDFGVDSVAFYREDTAGNATLLSTDTASPYQVDTTLPLSPVGTEWRYFARAFDGAGQHADSARVAITVR